jgi:integrase
MGKQTKVQTERRRQERKKQRASLKLHDKVLSPGLHVRYQQAAMRVLRFWKHSGSYPATWDDFDVATGQWLEHLFAEGYPKGYASDGLAALQHYLPEIAGKLRHSWRLLKSWQKMEPPVRVLPISPLMVVAISGACLKLNKPAAAAAFLVCFDTFLRPSELYHLRKQDITWAGGQAVLSLGQTKTGQRKNASEMVVCRSRVANYWLLHALKDKAPEDTLLSCSPASLRHLFFTILEHLQIPGYFSMYSFRRGGATWDFVVAQNIEQTLLRGRWASTSTARIYLQDAAATLSHLQITGDQKQYMRQLAQLLAAKARMETVDR